MSKRTCDESAYVLLFHLLLFLLHGRHNRGAKATFTLATPNIVSHGSKNLPAMDTRCRITAPLSQEAAPMADSKWLSPPAAIRSSRS
jgi:hypothetical protein